jgi:transposase-like protein
MGKRIAKEIKEEILEKIRAGESVQSVAEIFAVSTKTIYGWLNGGGTSSTVSLIKHNKLKRENEELKRIIGKITLELSRGKKD